MAEYIVPCNPKYYKVEEAFNDLKILDWKQSSTKIAIDDIVYIYVGNPIKAICYKCKVNKVNIDGIEIDDSKYVINGDNYLNAERHMELELLRTYDNEILSLNKMRENGVKGNIQCCRIMNDELSKYIRKIEEE